MEPKIKKLQLLLLILIIAAAKRKLIYKTKFTSLMWYCLVIGSRVSQEPSSAYKRNPLKNNYD